MTTVPKTAFSKFLKKMNWTSTDLAKAMRRPVRTIRSWRMGRRKPGSIDTREKLAKVLGLTMRQLNRLMKED